MNELKIDHKRARIFPILLALLGLILLAGGARLLSLGGSWWYAASGLVLIGSATLIWRGNRWGTWLYGFMLAYTTVWSIWEVGLNAWALVPRLLALGIIGFWLLTPMVQRTLNSGPQALSRRFSGIRAKGALTAGVAILVVALVVMSAALMRSTPVRDDDSSGTPTASSPGDWLNYGNDVAGTRFSALAQIKPSNIAHLKLAWTFRTGDTAKPGQEYSYEATPIKVGGMLYLCTPGGFVYALDASTGVEKWRFNSKDYHGEVPHPTCRGVSYYDTGFGLAVCAQRIYIPTPDAKLWSLDALSGQPCSQFGNGGAVDLLSGLGKVPKGMYAVTSPPVVTRGKLVIGSQVLDNISTDMPSGVIRAFDAVSGAFVWAWDLGAPGRTGAPPDGETYTRSTPNAWAPLSADNSLGLVYVPTGNPSPDFWGKNRSSLQEHFGSSIVALDVETGAVRWSFQTVHHDLWDNDLASQPTLTDVPTAQGLVPAVIQGTKQGEIFVLDRRTGVPIVPVTEKPAPGFSNIGEQLAATQPASALAVKPTPSPLTEAMMWGATPIDQLWCRIQFRDARYEGPYTPPDSQRTVLEYPAMFGGIEWGGLTVDPDRGILIANANAMPFLLKMARIDASAQSKQFDNGAARSGEMRPSRDGLREIKGTGYALYYGAFMSPLKIPCTQPPWGELYAIDLRTDKILWERPVGTTRDTGPLGIPSQLPLLIGTPQTGGTIVTRSGLIFSGATLDDYLRAYDLRSGRELWSARLPAGGQATPMTYESAGKQFIVIVAGGHGILGTKKGDHVLAYALE
jgi:quinoprotein glucose dehydrogenase